MPEVFPKYMTREVPYAELPEMHSCVRQIIVFTPAQQAEAEQYGFVVSGTAAHVFSQPSKP